MGVWIERCAIRAPAEQRAIGPVLWLSAVSIALYASTWLVERALFRNGIEVWTSVLDPGHPGSRTRLALQLIAYGVVTALTFGVYLRVLALSREGALATPAAQRIALATPALINVMLLFSAPRLSQDLYSYLAHGFLGVLPGSNPLVQGAEAVRGTMTGARLDSFGWHVSPGITPYGILWTRIEVAVAALSARHVWLGIELFKVLVIAASLGAAAMIWRILGQLRPGWQLTGTLAWLWNPLIIVEFAAEGHNDALMIFFALASLAACVTVRPVRSLLLQGFGALAKYVSVLFVPSQLVFLWRRRGSVRLSGDVVISALVLLVVAALLYAPFWVGAVSFKGLLHRDIPNGLASLFGVLGVVLRRTPLKPISDTLRLIVLTVPCVLFILWKSLLVVNARQLARVWMWSSLAFVLVASPDFWPWYACMPIALICVADLRRLFWLVFLVSVAGRLTAPMELLHDHGYLGLKTSKALITGIGSLLPLVALVFWQARRWGRRHASRRLGRAPENFAEVPVVPVSTAGAAHAGRSLIER